ncbi:adenylosuccinate synthetase [Methanocella sp. CWC-04]|uniref:Adenylosuccinate synthetase n=1 Tax=Methanooceanicella nereidis TaxID=2052831 RepID=A0AAP2W5M3_9EURY|nr:adenylosuccinate synthetase [Methanocella sp. CWC-04]MCD1294237.1 adenylosuccinate synthetase [Methanocella sp. CWC-04]
MVTTIVVGGFFGDEGKGKIVAHIANTDNPTIIARGGVGPNAGHTVLKNGVKHGVRMVPSGFVYDNARLLIGAGVLVDPVVLDREVSILGVGDRLGVDYRCSIIEEKHIIEDKGTEMLAKKIGTTGTGCGPANKERVMRSALQAKDFPSLKKYLTDVSQECNDAISRGENIIIEGSQGFGISLYYGTYPFVTSKDTSASQLAADVGVGPTRIDEVVVVFKAFPTRVGEGPFPTEMSPNEAKGYGIEEFGTVTGRARRIGYWDGKMARYSAMINGATQAAITGLDRIDPACKGVTDYDNLSDKVKQFLDQAEKDAGVPFTILSTGPEEHEIIDLRKIKK